MKEKRIGVGDGLLEKKYRRPDIAALASVATAGTQGGIQYFTLN